MRTFTSPLAQEFPTPKSYLLTIARQRAYHGGLSALDRLHSLLQLCAQRSVAFLKVAALRQRLSHLTERTRMTVGQPRAVVLQRGQRRETSRRQPVKGERDAVQKETEESTGPNQTYSTTPAHP